MSERSEYAPGTPSWIDIGCDVDKARAFYSGLFGWEYEAAGPPEETGGYGMFKQGGKEVAGLGPQQNPGPPFWTTYMTVADCDATATKVKEAGGQVVMDPMDVMTAGRMAVFQDPEGAFFSVWQAGDSIGAEVVNEPVSLSWNELNTRSLDGAKAFYGQVFDWDFNTMEVGPAGNYTEVKIGDSPIAGMVDVSANLPEKIPAHWLVYFAVDNTDATVEKAQDLGGSVMMPPTDIPPGRMAVITDDQGAHFAVIKLTEPA